MRILEKLGCAVGPEKVETIIVATADLILRRL